MMTLEKIAEELTYVRDGLRSAIGYTDRVYWIAELDRLAVAVAEAARQDAHERGRL